MPESLTLTPSIVTPAAEVLSLIVSVKTTLSLSFTPSMVTPLADVCSFIVSTLSSDIT